VTTPVSLAILSKALQASAGKVVEDNASRLLGDLLGAAVAGPAGAALAAIAGALIEALLKSTSAVERKLDTVLEEPLVTAVRLVGQANSVPQATPESRRERLRQLAHAYDLLAKAHTYAEKQHPEKVRLVRYYQTVVAAMRPDAHEFADLFVAELRAGIPPLFARAAGLRERARHLESDVEAARLAVKYAPRVGAESAENRALAMIDLGRVGSELADTLAEAKALEHAASELELFCQFAAKLSQQTLAAARAGS
jgi:hypothetical protein